MFCKIGDVEIWRVLQSDAPFLLPEEMFPDAAPDVGKTLDTHVPGGLCPETGRVMLPVQGFLLKTPTQCILIDTCVGNDKTIPQFPDWDHRTDNCFMASLTAAGVEVEDVDLVLCTHLHIDHIGWNTRLEDERWVPTFPKAQYLFPQEDEAMHRQADTIYYKESILPVIAAGQSELVTAGYQLGDLIALLPTPGHSPGHVSVLVQSGPDHVLFTGDALHSTAQCWHPEWHFVFDHDAEQAVASRRSLLEQAAAGDWLVVGSHFRPPSIGRVSAQGDAFQWHMETERTR